MSLPAPLAPEIRVRPPHAAGVPEGAPGDEDVAAARGAARVVARRIAAGAVVAMLAAAPYRLFELDRFFLPKEAVLLLTAAAACLGVAALWRAEGREAGARVVDPGVADGGGALDRFVDRALALYLAASAVSALFAASGWLALRALSITAAGAALFWAGRAAARRGAGATIVGALVVAVAVAAGTALLQAYGVRSEYFSVNRAPGGTFGNRNFVAHLCAVGLPLAAYAALRVRRFAVALGAVLVVLALGLMLVLSRSRGAWLAAAVSGVPVAVGLLRAAALARAGRARGRGARGAHEGRPYDKPGGERAGAWRPRPGRVLLLAVALALGAAGAIALPNALDWRSDSPYLDSVKGVVDYKEGSGRGRLAQWSNSLRLLGERPVLGVGPGNWSVRYPSVAPAGDPSLTADGTTANPWPSSDWVAVASERGVVGLGALAAAVLGLALAAHRGVWGAALGAAGGGAEGEGAAARALAGGALGGVLAAAAVAGAFDAVLLLAAPSAVIWPALGALSALAGGGEPGRAGRAAGAARGGAHDGRLYDGRGIARVGAAGLALAAAFALAHAAAMPLSEDGGAEGARWAALLAPGDYRVRLRAATVALGRGDCAGAREQAEAAHAIAPAAGGARRALAQCRGRRGR